MAETFANLPESIESTIASILSNQETTEWITRANILHDRYINHDTGHKGSYLHDFDDTLGYLGLRVPATYAQIYGSLQYVQAIMPAWQPTSILDLGSGPGTGVWAAKHIWNQIDTALCIDQEKSILTLGKQISDSLAVSMHWLQQDLREGIDQSDDTYDLVIIGNVFNELSAAAGEKLLGQAFNKTKGVLVIIESGTPSGSAIIQSAAKKLAHAGNLIAPYIDNTFVQNEEYWLHFSQKFIRPEFQRRIRQHMRESSSMASDWEDAKYSFAAISKIPSEITSYARVVGKTLLQKGYLEIPLLTNHKIEMIKVLKRDKKAYAFAKNLNWGDLISDKSLITHST